MPVLWGCQYSAPPSADAGWPDAHAVTLRIWPAGEIDERTGVRVRRHADSLDVRFTCRDNRIVAPFVGRDTDLYKGDVIEMFIDPQGDGRTIVEIQVNPNNDVLDLRLQYDKNRQLTDGGRLTEDSVREHFHSDRAFNLDDLRTAAGRSADGYWVELHISLDALRRAVKTRSVDYEKMRWNVVRLDHSPDGSVRQSCLVRVDPGCQHISPDRTLPIRPNSSRTQ